MTPTRVSATRVRTRLTAAPRTRPPGRTCVLFSMYGLEPSSAGSVAPPGQRKVRSVTKPPSAAAGVERAAPGRWRRATGRRCARSRRWRRSSRPRGRRGRRRRPGRSRACRGAGRRDRQQRRQRQDGLSAARGPRRSAAREARRGRGAGRAAARRVWRSTGVVWRAVGHQLAQDLARAWGPRGGRRAAPAGRSTIVLRRPPRTPSGRLSRAGARSSASASASRSRGDGAQRGGGRGDALADVLGPRGERGGSRRAGGDQLLEGGPVVDELVGELARSGTAPGSGRTGPRWRPASGPRRPSRRCG